MSLEAALTIMSIMTVIGGGILSAIWVEVRAIRRSVSGLSERVVRLETMVQA